jgi:hypothetical protein
MRDTRKEIHMARKGTTTKTQTTKATAEKTKGPTCEECGEVVDSLQNGLCQACTRAARSTEAASTLLGIDQPTETPPAGFRRNKRGATCQVCGNVRPYMRGIRCSECAEQDLTGEWEKAARPAPTPEPESPPATSTLATASDVFQAKVQAILALTAQGEAAIAQALRKGQLSVRLPRTVQASTPRQPARHHALSDETKAAMVADRNAGMSYVQIDQKYSFEDAVQTRGRVSWCVCRDARKAGLSVR